MITTIMLIVLGLVLLSLIYVLFAPITVYCDIVLAEKVSLVSALKIFPFKFGIYPGRSAKKTIRRRKTKIGARAQSGIRKKPDLSKLGKSDIDMLLNILGKGLRFSGRIIKAPDYYLNAALAGGAAEPDITGQLYGAYHAIKPGLPRSIRLSYTPDFMSEKFQGSISCGLAVRLIVLLKEISIFLVRLPIIRLIKLYRRIMK